jgi:hypothetical protein
MQRAERTKATPVQALCFECFSLTMSNLESKLVPKKGLGAPSHLSRVENREVEPEEECQPPIGSILSWVCAQCAPIGHGLKSSTDRNSEDGNGQAGFERRLSSRDYSLLASSAGKSWERRRASISCNHGTKRFHPVPVSASW